MKNILLKTSLFCLLLFTISCAKNTEYLEAPGNTFMKAKVNGKLVECSITNATIYDAATKTIQITGNKGTEGFSIMLNNYKGAGKYTLSENGTAIYLGNSTDSQNTSYMTVGNSVGTVNITKVTDKAIEGTFEFKGVLISGSTEITVTEGSFSISLVIPAGPIANPGNTNMSAKIDGTAISFTGQAMLTKSSVLGNLMQIIGVNGNKALTIGIFDYNGVGTYLINDQTSHQGGYTPNNAGSDSFSSSSGKIIITSATSTSIKGTFEFEAPNDDFQKTTKVSVKEGKFEMSFETVTM